MTKAQGVTDTLQGLLELHAMDQEIDRLGRELRQTRDALSQVDDAVSSLEASLKELGSRAGLLRRETREGERGVDDRRDALSRLRTKLEAVKTERQYSAATLEEDMLRRDIRKREEQVLEKMQVLEDLERRRQELSEQLELVQGDAGPRRQLLEAQASRLEEELAIRRDRRDNLAIRLQGPSLRIYNRIRSGRSEVAMAPLTTEGVCGHCFTAVPAQQQMLVRTSAELVCCEGCGVILYPRDLQD
jgi:predicted  nucleic acid-binding Zn-ribbon protein